MKLSSDILVKASLMDYYNLEGRDYVFNVAPVAKPRMTQRDRWANRPCVLKFWTFKDELLLAADEMKFELPDQFLIVYNIPFPKSYSIKKKDKLRGEPHQMKPDIDNLTKAVLDVFKVKDESVWSHWARKVWADEPSVVITI